MRISLSHPHFRDTEIHGFACGDETAPVLSSTYFHSRRGSSYLDGVNTSARRIWVRVAESGAALLAQGPVLAEVFPVGAAVTVRSALYAGVESAREGAAVRRADLIRLAEQPRGRKKVGCVTIRERWCGRGRLGSKVAFLGENLIAII